MMLFMGSCGGSGSAGADYNPATCEELQQKVENNEDLTSDDYNEMIDQMMGALRLLDRKVAEAGDAAGKSLTDDPETLDMAKYAFGFAIYLGMHQNNLSVENLKKLKEAQLEIEKLQRQQ